jgi:hypothetical protein
MHCLIGMLKKQTVLSLPAENIEKKKTKVLALSWGAGLNGVYARNC